MWRKQRGSALVNSRSWLCCPSFALHVPTTCVPATCSRSLFAAVAHPQRSIKPQFSFRTRFTQAKHQQPYSTEIGDHSTDTSVPVAREEELKITLCKTPPAPKKWVSLQWRVFWRVLARTVGPVGGAATGAHWLHLYGWDAYNIVPELTSWFFGAAFLGLILSAYRGLSAHAIANKAVYKVEYLPGNQKVRLTTPVGEIDWPQSWVAGAEEGRTAEKALEDFKKGRRSGVFLPLSVWEQSSPTLRRHHGAFIINFDPGSGGWFLDFPRMNAILQGKVPVVEVPEEEEHGPQEEAQHDMEPEDIIIGKNKFT